MKLQRIVRTLVMSAAVSSSIAQADYTITTDGFNTGSTAETPWEGGGTVTGGQWSLSETGAFGRLVVGDPYAGYGATPHEGTGLAQFSDAAFDTGFAGTITDTVGHYFNAGDTVAIDFWTSRRTTGSDNGGLAISVSLVGAATLTYAGTYTPASSTWAQSTTEYLTITTAGIYNVQFANAETFHNKTTFFDSVSYQVISSASTYSTWASDNSIPGQPASGDFDKDGLTNIVEYALGLSPTVSSVPPGTFDGSLLSFNKGAEAKANGDVTYEIEQSTTLDGWTVVVPDAPASATISYTLPSGQPKEFARLKITQIP